MCHMCYATVTQKCIYVHMILSTMFSDLTCLFCLNALFILLIVLRFWITWYIELYMLFGFSCPSSSYDVPPVFNV